MFLGELIQKYEEIDRKIDLYQNSLSSNELDGNKINIFINDLFEDISKSYNYKYSVYDNLKGIEVELREGERVSLYKVFMLRDITKTKLKILDIIIENNCYDLDMSSLFSNRESLVSDLVYINTIINKEIWSRDLDIKSLG